ncbi:diheme cytochrome c [Paraburkholderia diazotrophica]|uniref:Dihaem cytochrome c n=1 Tax=Paraburkholderia diazotrophica TaxID=667676 RepID=A0A1H7C1X1_9BURK|nr:diheme cytochrome c [Paraburkholderia diazotrophica]SEJ83691.1 Dihaem cytochrome c [Paraburkholderia diazotrophica]
MPFELLSRSAVVCVAAILSSLAASKVVAETDEMHTRTNLLPKYRQECATCHIAYPPSMLPNASWQRILGNLSHHYGTDASLDADSVKQISTWLATNSGGGETSRVAPPEDRITRSAWFRDEHAEIPAAVWKRPTVRSASNCAACHTHADQGNFDEHFVRIPQ